MSEHIATFSVTEAADALLPHIWFDPEWHITLPMAIAAHRRRSKLVNRLWSYHSGRPTSAQKVVNDRLEELILEVAAQTDPKDWNKANRDRIRALDESFTPRRPKPIANSAHRDNSNHAAEIIKELPNADPSKIPLLVRELLELVAWRLNSFTVWWGNGAWRINQPRPCRFVTVTKRYLRRWCVQAPQPQGQRSGRGSCCWPPRESRMR